MKQILACLVMVSLLLISVSALSLNVNSPKQENVFNSNSILFSLNISEMSNKALFYYANLDNSGSWIKICPIRNFICEKNMRVKEGLNQYEFKAVDNNGITSNIVYKNFSVDSRDPLIINTIPSSNSLVSSVIFSIKYTEKNLKNITLYYGSDQSPNINCESGEIKICNFTEINLSKYNGQTIEYWFTVKDQVNSVNSSKKRVKVDTEKPIVSKSYSIDVKKVKFIFDVQEKNFKDIRITEDTNNCGLAHAPSGLLCSNLINGRCIVSRNFCNGDHNLTITTTDKAGNSDVSSVSFNIDS